MTLICEARYCDSGQRWIDYRLCLDCAGTGYVEWWDEGDVACPRLSTA